jgi:ferric-dicitrate binding protein FerR (iron transport regulator)
MMSSIRLLGRCPANFRLSGALGALVLVGLLAQTTPSQAAPKTKESRELQAREAFATGRYQEAIELYGKLYAEKLHPTYLRNIGRCYQKLKEPEKAIDSFRDYLGRVKNIPAAEKSEIEGYIAEMEALKKKQDADKAAAAAPAAVVAPVVAPVPRLEPAAPAPQTQLLAATPPPAPESTPFYKRGWFWGVTAGVVAVAVVGALWAAGVFSKSFDPCAGRSCQTASGGP